MVLYPLTIFLSAFLLFQVQPLIGKYILPWFGGGPAVWTTCMLFFQVLLLAGYASTHLVTSKLSPRAQGWTQLGILGLALLFLPIGPDAAVWKPASHQWPGGKILLLLLVNVGLPYFVLSTTAPTLQRWFSVSFPGRSPYRLYALSNTGSLLALLSYPFLFEPTLTLDWQVGAWSAAFGGYVLLCGACALKLARSRLVVEADQPQATASQAAPRPSGMTITLWLLLSAMGSAMLLATTNQLCQEVAVVPFLWVLPLSIYLLTFIICFDRAAWYDRRWFGPLLIICALLGASCVSVGLKVDMVTQVVIYCAVLFVVCMSCHGEMVRSKPSPRYLTLFYLTVSAGGALGGLFVALVAPAFFLGFWEYHIALAGGCILIVTCWFRDRAWAKYFRRPYGLFGSLAAGCAVLAIALTVNAVTETEEALAVCRNFYGVLRVKEADGELGVARSLLHGRIDHGMQFLEGDRRRWSTTYFTPSTAIGLGMTQHPRRHAADPRERSLRVGVIGLGVGTIAAYGRPGDYVRFYEINPEVERISREYFTYRSDCPATVDVVLGDARVCLEQELARNEPQDFDILVVDAFTSDAIPVHLLTEECGKIYAQHLKPDGLLLLHLSNRYLNLCPVARGLAERLGMIAAPIETRVNRVSKQEKDRGFRPSLWVILTRNQEFLSSPYVARSLEVWTEDALPPLVWTDSYASLWGILKFDDE